MPSSLLFAALVLLLPRLLRRTPGSLCVINALKYSCACAIGSYSIDISVHAPSVVHDRLLIVHYLC